MFIIKYRKFFVGLAILLVLVSLVTVALKGLKFGAEFTGGSVLEVSYEDARPDVQIIRNQVDEMGLNALVQPFGDNGYVIKTKDITENQRQQLVKATNAQGAVSTIERFNSIGPSVGRELKTKSLYALIAVSLGIVFFIAYAFRKVTEPVASWKYGIIAVIALLHDLIIPIGILTLIGTEIDTLYVVGLLSILGLSVNDTIVVFDRVRENLEFNDENNVKQDFSITVGGAIKDTLVRSIFTSLTLVFVLLSLYILGPAATQTLSLVLLLGIIVGTYSSVFLASPLLTYFVNTTKTTK
jgi:preprotein translocase subunit SecF